MKKRITLSIETPISSVRVSQVVNKDDDIDAIVDLFEQALLGLGYAQSTINEHLVA